MRVLLVVGSLTGGGAERVMAWLAGALVEAGDSVCLITQHQASRDFYPLNPKVNRVALGWRRYLDSSTVSGGVNYWSWRQLLRSTARRQQCDVVLSFIDQMNLSVLSAFAGSGIPVVVSERVDPRYSLIGRFYRTIRPHFYRYLACRVVVQTEAIAARTRADWGLSSVIVVPNAVLIKAEGTPNPPDRRLRVLSVGRLARQKGHDLLIDAWARLAVRFPNWQLRIVGEGPMRSALEEQVARLGVAESVSLPGLIDDVEGEYRAASIFVLPSRFEGFPNALLEAMACGCAPIATRDAGASIEVIQPGLNGMLVPGENVDALAEELSQLMLDGDLRTRYAVEATGVAAQYAPDRIFQLWRQALLDGAGLN